MKIGLGISPMFRRGGVDWSSYCTPLLWDWVLPITIQQKGNLFRVNPTFDLETYANISVAKTYYLNTVSGSDAANGLTPLTPNKTMNHIIQGHGDADEIIIQDGSYVTRQDMLFKPARNTKVKGEGTVYITNDFVNYMGAWSLSAGRTYTYQSTMVGGEYANVALDSSALDVYGRSSRYTYRDSIDLVEANPGSLFWAAGVMYVHALDGNTLTGRTDITFHYGGAWAQNVDNRVYYFENINFIGGVTFGNSSVAGGTKIYLKSCKAWAYTIAGINEVILQNCEGDRNTGDVVNIANKNAVECNIIEIDCDFRYGFDNASSQASTSHHDSRVVRLNGKYHDVSGQCAADVDTAMILMLGSELYNSTSGIGYYFGGSLAWLDTVHIHDCATADLQNEVGTTIYTHNCTLEKGVNIIAGTLTPY